MGRDSEVQSDLIVTWAEIPRSPGHVFYDKLQKLLAEAGFDGFVEKTCKPYYAPRMGAPSLPPGRYFRMLLIGYFEGIDSERGIVWRCSDSLSLREFLRLSSRDKVPDHRSYGEVNSGRRSARMPLLMNNLWSPACLLQLTAPKRCPLFA
nr:transposase [Sphingobium lactosutens]